MKKSRSGRNDLDASALLCLASLRLEWQPSDDYWRKPIKPYKKTGVIGSSG